MIFQKVKYHVKNIINFFMIFIYSCSKYCNQTQLTFTQCEQDFWKNNFCCLRKKYTMKFYFCSFLYWLVKMSANRLGLKSTAWELWLAFQYLFFIKLTAPSERTGKRKTIKFSPLRSIGSQTSNSKPELQCSIECVNNRLPCLLLQTACSWQSGHPFEMNTLLDFDVIFSGHLSPHNPST